MSAQRTIRTDFQEFLFKNNYENYVNRVGRYTMDHYGFNAGQAYPKTTERVALACFECDDEPAIAGDLIAQHHDIPKMLTLD